LAMAAACGSCSQPALQSWRAALAELREENAALLDCLVAAGVLSFDTFRARLHRRRFAADLRAHPLSCCPTLIDMLAPAALALSTASFAGLPASRSLEATCSDVLGSIRVLASAVRKACMKVYVCGGNDGGEFLTSMERFDPSTGHWEELPPMPEQRHGAFGAAVGGRLYVCGGMAHAETLSSVECFDPLTGTWAVAPPMLTARVGASTAAVGGLLYVCGGSSDGGYALNLVERFDPEAMTWEALPPMRIEARYWAAVATLARHLFLFGGYCQGALSSTGCYDPSDGRWEALPSMSQPRSGAVAAAASGRLYVCGGEGPDEIFLSVVELYDPVAGAWLSAPAMSWPRSAAVAVSFAGRVYVCGGEEVLDGYALSSAECFDSREGTWQALAPMHQPRALAIGATFCW